MKRKGAPFEAAKSGPAIYVRVHGLGSMHNAATLEAFAERALADGALQFVFDLADCTGVDSTFMGLLLTISNRLREQAGPPGPRGCVLINLDDHAFKQLSSVGLDTLLTVKPGKTALPGNLTLTELNHLETSDRDRLKLMVRAHKELVQADERNKAKFGAFLQAIVAELG